MKLPALLAFGGLSLATAEPAVAQEATPLRHELESRVEAVIPKVVAWRRDIHQHPELGNRELRTAHLVEEHLRDLGLDVKGGVAHTGVVGLLQGGRPGRVVALRADMDALPVTEETDLPFKSTARAVYNGQEVGVMHACGHDAHVAMLMGVAEVLAGVRQALPGSVKFIFQPAEEGPPAGEEGGAALMVKEGVLENPKVDAIFGLHVFPFTSGALAWRARGIMAASDVLEIVVHGRQTHGALPWRGVDPIVISSQIVLGLQTLVSRQADLTTGPAILTIGRISGGNRYNIIPDAVTMSGTIRTFDRKMRQELQERVRRTVKSIAESAGASADVTISEGTSLTYNDPALVERAAPTLRRVAGDKAIPEVNVTTTAEDFSYFAERVPGLFFFLGVTPSGTDPATAAPNHSPRFFVDEDALEVGVRALASLAVDYLMPQR